LSSCFRYPNLPIMEDHQLSVTVFQQFLSDTKQF
jgi:hypothetical protein